MKYLIQKTDGSKVDPNATYFVLRLDKPDRHGQICRRLATMYAEMMMTIDPDASRAALNAVRTGHETAIGRWAVGQEADVAALAGVIPPRQVPDCGEAGHAEGRCGNVACIRPNRELNEPSSSN